MLKRLLRTRLWILALAVLCVAPAVAQDWTGRGRLQGRVTDERTGKGVEGATVHLYYGAEKQGPPAVTTDRKGRWSVLGLTTGEWTIDIEKEGFVPRQGTTMVSQLKVNPSVDVPLRHVEDTEQAKKGRKVVSELQQANDAFTKGDYDQARKLFQEILPEIKDDSKPAVILGIAQTYIKQSQWQPAMESVQQVLALDPKNVGALKLEASIYGQEKQVDKAVEILQQIITDNPQDTAAIQQTANILLAQGREAEAQKYIDMLPKGMGVDPDALLNLGIDKYNGGDYKAALSYFDRVVAQSPNLAIAYYYRGLAHLASSENDAAKADLQKVIDLDPKGPKAAEAKQFLDALH